MRATMLRAPAWLLVPVVAAVAVGWFSGAHALIEGCDPAACTPPSCQCAQTQPPAGLATQDTPQFVLFTLDDGFSAAVLDLIRPCVPGSLSLATHFGRTAPCKQMSAAVARMP